MRRRFTSNKYFPINTDNYMTIEALEDGLSACLSTNVCEYCIDGDGNWKSLAAGIATEIINSGHTLSFRGELTSNSSNGIGTFAISKKCNLKGNCMSLLFGDNAADNSSLNSSWAFYKLFYNCTNIINVSSNFLPATTLTHHCYEYMFESCKGLINSPELPATNLKDSCYYAMFARTNVLPDCSNIDFTSRNVVYSNGLRGLFKNTKVTDNDLNRILPKNSNGKYCLPVILLSELCYDNMFEGCTSLTTAPELPATTLANYCYNSMFYGCTSLTTAPELPAMTLAESCYQYMFYNCTSLTTAPELPATTLATYCYTSMFQYCRNLTVAPELPATTLANYCYNSMFYGCTNLTTAPELPATTLKNYCYQYMFSNCSKLNYIKMLATDIPTTSCLTGWVNDVASSGTFVKNPAMTSLPTATSSNHYAGIPSGWTVVNDGNMGEEITFYFNTKPIGDEYTLTAREGMTWLDWVASEHNTIGIELGNNGDYAVNFMGLTIVDNHGDLIRGSDLIINEFTYML